MKSQLQELVRNSAWIYGFIAFALLASLVLDITGISRNELSPDAIFFLPSLLASVYCIAPALLFRFAIVRSSFHWAVASVYVVVAYFGWFVLMVALTGAPYNRPSYMVLLSLVAAWRILCFKTNVEAPIEAGAEENRHKNVASFDDETQPSQCDEPRCYTAAPTGSTHQLTKLSPDKLSSLLASEGAIRIIALLAATACTWTVVLNAQDWTKSKSTVDLAALLAFFILPSIGGAFCVLLGWMWSRCAAFAVVAFVCFSIIVFEPRNMEDGAVFALAMAFIPIVAPLFRIGLRRKEQSNRRP